MHFVGLTSLQNSCKGVLPGFELFQNFIFFFFKRGKIYFVPYVGLILSQILRILSIFLCGANI